MAANYAKGLYKEYELLLSENEAIKMVKKLLTTIQSTNLSLTKNKNMMDTMQLLQT